MADFKNHWRFGLLTSSVSATTLAWLEMYNTRLLPMLVIVGWVGSIIPDIDSDTSKPRRLIFDGLCFLLPPALIYRMPLLHSTPIYAVLSWALMAVLILKPLKWIFKRYTKHRGVFHSIPAALIYSVACALLAFHEAAPKNLQVSIMIIGFIGFITHLVLDEIWAVDFNGSLPSRKRSFGTALNWGGSSVKANYLLYIVLILSVRIYWSYWYDEPVLPELLRVTLSGWGGAIIETIQN